MFNKTIIEGAEDNRTIINYPKTLEINEKRAPTDDSIRLLKEMEEKTLDKLIIDYVPNNVLEYIMLVKLAKVDNIDEKILVRFKINNKEYKLIIKLYSQQLLMKNGQEIMEEIHTELSKIIASELLEKAYQESFKNKDKFTQNIFTLIGNV
jgi:hypothetical protein